MAESIDRLQEKIKSQLIELISIDVDFDDYEADEKLTDDALYKVFNPYIYIEDLRKAGALIIKSDSEPENFGRIISTIRECFAFQQYLAVAALCRTALEVVLRDLYQKLGFTTKKTPEHAIAKTYFDEIKRLTGKAYPNQFDPSPRDLRYLICRLPEFEEFKEDLDTLYGDLSRIVHGSSTVNKIKSEEYMKETFWIIHEMYLEVKNS